MGNESYFLFDDNDKMKMIKNTNITQTFCLSFCSTWFHNTHLKRSKTEVRKIAYHEILISTVIDIVSMA